MLKFAAVLDKQLLYFPSIKLHFFNKWVHGNGRPFTLTNNHVFLHELLSNAYGKEHLLAVLKALKSK